VINTCPFIRQFVGRNKPCLKSAAALRPGEATGAGGEGAASCPQQGRASCRAAQQSLTAEGERGSGRESCCSIFQQRITTSLFQLGTCSSGQRLLDAATSPHLQATFRKLWESRNSLGLKALDKESTSF